MEDEHKKEILDNFKTPIDYLHFYENFNSFSSKVKYGRGDEINFMVGDESARYEDKRKSKGEVPLKETHNDFCKDNKLINFCRVFCFETKTTESSRRRDFYTTETEYALYYKGIRIKDGYIDFLLPESKCVKEDECNDSTPGPGNTTKIYFRLSYLETERFLERSNLNDHCNYLANKLKSDKYIFGKVEKQIVFHEFGHIFGLFLSKKMGYDFGELQKIALDSKNTPSVLLSKDIFKHINISHFDEYENLKNRKELNLDKRRFLSYSLFVLSGAIFNVYCFNIQPTYYEFERIFIDDHNKEKYGKFIARAGNDFSKLCSHRFELEWGYYDFMRFKYMAYEFFYILNKNGIFNKLGVEEKFNDYDFTDMTKTHPTHWANEVSLLSIFEKKFNGKITTEKRYYISSLEADAREFGRCVRGHWAIESMHWHLDVTFREDFNKTLDETGALNLNILRKMALSILKTTDIGRKCSQKLKRFYICANPTKFLTQVLNS